MNITNVAVSAAVSAVVAAVVAGSMGRLQAFARRVATRVRKHFEQDHQTINAGTVGGDPGGRACFFVSVKCAPSKWLRRPRPLNAKRVCDFVSTTWGSLFPHDPTYCDPGQIIRFQGTSERVSPTERSTACVLTVGVIEAALAIPHHLDTQGQLIIDLLDVARPVVKLVEAIRASTFHAVFAGRKMRRRPLDWYVGLAPHIIVNGGTTQSWADLGFPGRRPTSRAREQRPSVPTPGFGQQRVWGRKQSTDSVTLLREVLHDLLSRSGYIGFEDALADTLAALGPIASGKEPS